MINEILETIHNRLPSFRTANNRQNQILWNLERRGQRDASRVTNFVENYTGPDRATVELMRTQGPEWASDTRSFWAMGMEQPLQNTSPLGVMVEHFLRAQGRDP